MYNRKRDFILIFIVFILLQACKKNNNSNIAPPPNDLVETSPPYQKPITVFINQYIGGYYQALPFHYDVTTKKYPLLIFLHGGGQTGDGDKNLPLVLNDGVAKEIQELKFPANFNVDGNNFSFVVLSPQFRDYPPDSMVYSFIQFALRNYRIDSSRIYLSGLSMGGILTTNLAGEHTSLFAAVAPLSGETYDNTKELSAANIAHGLLPLWAFHNSDDPSVPVSVATNFIGLINNYNPGIAPKLTIFQASGHDAWTKALDPGYKENNMNLYEWMLQYKR
jgi:poly(3-hydroxybutyrate) depolymerase